MQKEIDIMSPVSQQPVQKHINIYWTDDLDYERRPSLRSDLYEISPLLPFGLMLILSTLIFILIFFRRWPGLVAAIVAGCLTSVSIYFLLLSLKHRQLVYE